MCCKKYIDLISNEKFGDLHVDRLDSPSRGAKRKHTIWYDILLSKKELFLFLNVKLVVQIDYAT